MNAQLEKLFHLLEKDRTNLFLKLSDLPEEHFQRPSPKGGWSIQQIVAHLITSERLSLAYMKKKSLGIDQLDNSGITQSVTMIILKLSQRLPFKFKAPALVVQHTPAAQSLDQLKSQWEAVRSDLKTFLDTIADKNIRKKIYKHPIAGKLDCRQALEFFCEHFHHHYPQIKHLL